MPNLTESKRTNGDNNVKNNWGTNYRKLPGKRSPIQICVAFGVVGNSDGHTTDRNKVYKRLLTTLVLILPFEVPFGVLVWGSGVHISGGGQRPPPVWLCSYVAMWLCGDVAM